MQAPSNWTPPSGTLGRLVHAAGRRAAKLRVRAPELERRLTSVPQAPDLVAALRRPDVAIIAEVKRRSPSRGWISPHLSAARQAEAYTAGGAAAISVLTEPESFGGSSDDLVDVRGAVSLPVLKKDFHTHSLQLLEAKALGASAALLIVRALSPRHLQDMMRAARDLDLTVLVEIGDESELQRAIDSGASLIGINNRDLETLTIDPTKADRLTAQLPATITCVTESGVNARADVERIACSGADAILVGSSVSGAEDPEATVRGLTGVPRVARRD